MFWNPGPSTAAMAMARIRLGMVSVRSVNRISTSSVQPPTKPATAPTSVPISVPIRTTPNPASTETVVPAIVSDSTSCPSSFVPNGCASEGGRNRAEVSTPPTTCSGYGATAGPKTAKNRTTATMIAPTTDSRLCRNLCHARAAPSRGGAVRAGLSGAMLSGAISVTSSAPWD
jgi:hypothetical protein